MKNFEKVKRDILAECADDYVGLWSVIWELRHVMNEEEPTNLRSNSIALIEELLREGLIKAGIPKISGEFEEWQLSPDEIVRRIDNEWDSLGREPNIGDIVWFTTTKAGDAKAQEFRN